MSQSEEITNGEKLDIMYKKMPIKHSFVSIKISPTNLVSELKIQENFCSQTRLVGLIFNKHPSMPLLWGCLFSLGLIQIFIELGGLLDWCPTLFIIAWSCYGYR